jgi:glycosyltransferase involved in cell wall biosynthesis
MKILLLAPHPFYQYRGTPIAVKLLAQALAGNGHKICILTYHEGDDINIPQVDLCRIPKLPGIHNIKPGPSIKKLICDFVFFFKCLLVLKRHEFDIIHAVEESAFLAVIIKKLYHMPYVFDMDSSMPQQVIDKYFFLKPLRPALEYLQKIAILKSAGIVAVCSYLESIAVGVDSHKPVLRLQDISLLDDHSEPGQDVRKHYNIDGSIIMYVGNLERYQGIDLLLESFQRVLQISPRANLVIVGGATDDIEKYQARAKRLQIETNTFLIGPRPISQLGSLLNQADILISPRIQGGNTPMKIYSYMDSGRPLIATRLYSHTQVLDDNIALLVDPNSEAMSDGILFLLGDRNYRESLAARARNRAKAEYSFDAFKQKLTAFYITMEKTISTRKYAEIGGKG